MSIQPNTAKIIVPATCADSFGEIAATPPGDAAWDWVELRLDQFQPPPAQLPWPVLLTPRHPDEGGAETAASPDARAALCAPWLEHAAGIDIEIAHAGAMAGLLDQARSEGLIGVLSFHDFAATPDADALRDTVRAGIASGADVVKLATHTASDADAGRLLALLDEFPEQAMAVMGMGPAGKASRLAAAARGSVLNYACVGEPTVVGQWGAAEFKARIGAGDTR